LALDLSCLSEPAQQQLDCVSPWPLPEDPILTYVLTSQPESGPNIATLTGDLGLGLTLDAIPGSALFAHGWGL